MDYNTLTTGQKAAFTRRHRDELFNRNETAYRAAMLFAQNTDTETVANTLGVSIHQARGFKAAYTRGEYVNCRF